jgi:hypothetical protein
LRVLQPWRGGGLRPGFLSGVSGATLLRETLVSGLTMWLKLYSFHHDGEVYEYVYEVCSNSDTQQQAHDIATRNSFGLRAQTNFLMDVDMKKVQH